MAKYNVQAIFLKFEYFSSIIDSVIYRRKSSLESEKQILKQSITRNQQVGENAENHEGDITYQGMNK